MNTTGTSSLGTQPPEPGGVDAKALRTPEGALAHVPRLVTKREVRAAVHGTSAVGQFNNRLAVMITRGVGTMWAAYLFALISLVSFPAAFKAFASGDTVTGITWLSQSFIQLVLLPIIVVGQNIISAAQDARAEADHETLTSLHTINVQQLKILDQQQSILEMLQAREA